MGTIKGLAHFAVSSGTEVPNLQSGLAQAPSHSLVRWNGALKSKVTPVLAP